MNTAFFTYTSYHSINFPQALRLANVCTTTGAKRPREPYQISIKNFAPVVREYIEKKGRNHHVCFLVDEVGQYIGDDSRLMLNLQTIREELGKECKGKAWVIVTSQQ